MYLDITSVYGSQINLLAPDNVYKLPSPIKQLNHNCFLSSMPIKISGCVLPGMDFRTGQTKICQDDYVCFIHNNCIICVLCDGHGSEGHYISKFVVEYTEKYFKKYFSKFRHDPKSVLSEMMQKCDKKIIANMDCELSGTTAVVLLIDGGIAYSASLGDSRAIIGTLSQVADVAHPRVNKYFRRITTDRNFKAIPLTQDQKPEHNDEMMRIRMSGGIVEKYTDAFGRNVGPYRVWNKDGTGPGLAMSRSLGDKVAKACGVISLPLYLDRALTIGKDQYIVVASDGVWDVMDNIEVINFIDKWKGKCDSIGSDDYPAVLSNSSISRLLCEEARYRWYGVAEQERVAIDDISCVIMSFTVDECKDSVIAGEGETKLVKLEGSTDFTNCD